MKRAKPDPFRLGVFLAIKAEFDPQFETPAGEIWRRWCDYAERRRVSPGTPRSFSNALRKVGCPWSRPYESRTRYHTGIRLARAWWPEEPERRRIMVRNSYGDFVRGPNWHADATGQPLIYMSRGLLPGRWLPARVLKVDGEWWVEPLE
jgi:hypothetical protein